jgi:arylsulfatase A-like enzyme
MYVHSATPAPHVGKWAVKHDRPEDAVDPNAWRGRLTDSQVHRARSGYFGEITFIDHQIGRLMNWMDRFRSEALARTWIVFASDHGDMQSDHHLLRKTYAYEGSSRIPLIVVPPAGTGRPDRKIADEVVELRDLMPTLLDAAGLPIPETVDGASLLPLLDAPPKRWRSYLHGEHCTCYSAEQEMHFVTDGRRKFIWLPRINRTQFFDLEADPAELNDLVHDGNREDEVQLWRERLIDELKGRDCGWVKNGELYCPADEPLISPYKHVRWQGHD